jgi:cytoskeletal protein CcmA (bactofilin family)
MASTYSDRLKLELQGTGENAGTWGDKTNNNLDVIDAFAAGFISKNVGGSADVTLTTANASATAESSNKVIDLNGTLTGDITVFIPAKENNYIVYNNTSGSFSLTIAATGHAANGVAITQGAYDVVYCDGASNYNVSRILSNFGAISTQDLTVTGNVNASVDANITGNAAITGNIAVTGTANVTADANVAGNVNVTSTINGSTATFSGNVNADNFVSTNELVYTDGTVGNISVRNLITTTSTSTPDNATGDDGDFYLIHDA